MKKLSVWLVFVILLSGCALAETDSHAESFSTTEMPDSTLVLQEAQPSVKPSSEEYNTSAIGTGDIKWYTCCCYSVDNRTYIQIQAKDKEYTDKVNNVLYNAQIGWIEEVTEKDAPFPSSLYLQCHNERYLSLVTDMHVRLGHNHRFPEYAVTVDMQTGELVRLDDILNVCEEFAKQIQECRGVVTADSSMAEHDGWEGVQVYPGMKESISEFTIEEIMEMLDECSKTAQDYAEDTFGLITKSTFFLEEGYLTIILKDSIYIGSGKWLTFDLESIEEFLLVEKW